MVNHCINCNEIIESPLTFTSLFQWKSLDDDLVCHKCFSQFQSIQSDYNCKTCSKPLDHEGACSECQAWKDRYPHIKGNHHSIFHYNDFAKEWMVTFKMQGDIRYGLAFGKVLKEKIQKDFPNHVLVPIPSSPQNLLERGFNQIDVILSVLTMDFSRLLERQASDKSQAKKTRQERLATAQPFTYSGEGSLEGLDILLIDDVYTTGRTLYHAKDLLSQKGASRVDSLSLFR